MRIFTHSLHLPEDFFDIRLTEQAHTLRFLHYPPLDEASIEAAKSGEQSTSTVIIKFLCNFIASSTQLSGRAGEHSDYGAITLLFQDDVGGLEVRRSDGQWIEAPCIPNTVLVNTGMGPLFTLLILMSNGWSPCIR